MTDGWNFVSHRLNSLTPLTIKRHLHNPYKYTVLRSPTPAHIQHPITYIRSSVEDFHTWFTLNGEVNKEPPVGKLYLVIPALYWAAGLKRAEL